ncbi:YgfZ/GcvT domain-containing protein [Nesterenkonia lutea]|uniref:Folate-binding protein YgfZ n=1 Tax=Nesterenkonia lutea TaxID=272919 RepID=A0ABR9JAT3_9MICC|nr:folate-binding protein YgfZ [Nesterenkonia lutea]MBE1523036.1 folate-binding protein YgfZ [Nesterenkonia lutea]
MDESLSSELLSRPGAVPDGGDDAQVAAHYGDPTREQRALARGSAVVDLSHRSVVTVSGPDRLSWLTTLSSQQVTGLKPGEPTELLLLDISGRIEHDAAVIDDGETVWLITEKSHGPVLAQWLDAMKFTLRVEITDRTADFAVLGSMAALPEAASGAPVMVWEDPWPRLGPGAASYAAIDEADHPGADWSWQLSLVERSQLGAIIDSLQEAGWILAGTMAAEALRIAAWRPRLAREVDEKAIPHELDLIRTAVHLSKGCYKGQETVARVHNLGHPPRRLVFLHLDGSEHTLPAIGSDVLAATAGASEEQLVGERPVGKVTSVARHHEMGPIALALVKRKVDPELQLVVRDAGTETPSFYAAAQEVIVRPDAGQAVGRPQGDFLRAPRR